ncbi:MAG: MFS transporter [Desulfatitalea sp.]|nr:MFS transporter [Desulfatitalea sp.]
MTANTRNRGILGSQYFLYFGVMGMHLPFFNLYCYELGFSGLQIGTLSATRSVVLILFSLFWSLLADRFQTRRGIYILCNFFSAALWALFLLTANYWWMLVITIFHGMFFAPLIAFLEAFAMEVLGRDKKRYGRMRAWGSVAFIVVVLSLGRAIDAYGVKIILSLILAGSWVQALVALGFPRSTPRDRQDSARWRALLTPRVTLFLFCAFLMLLSHGAYYTFFSIHLSTLGYDSFFIGISWAVAVAAEIFAMLFSERLFKRLRYETVLIISFAVAVLRWAGLSGAESAAALLALQATHAITYGAFHMASILYIDALAPPAAKTLGQAANNAVTYGLGLMTGFFLSGALYHHIGARGLFAISSGVALLGGIVFAGYSALQKNATAN